MSAVVAGHEDLTLDADSPLAIQSRPELSSSSGDRFGMELLEGESGASKQADSLLQTRLRAASLALGFGTAIFALWTIIRKTMNSDLHLGYSFMAIELFTAVSLIGIGVWLARVPSASSRCLWWCELAIFGLPALFFAILHYLEVVFIA